jgi:hypothetical protein
MRSAPPLNLCLQDVKLAAGHDRGLNPGGKSESTANTEV